MSHCDPTAATAAQKNNLAESLQPRLRVEEYFARSGRTLRKSRFRLWFNLHIKRAVLKFILKLFGIYARGIRNALRVQVNNVQLYFEDLPPSFEGFEILHVSDFHIDKMDGLVEVLVPALAELRPDLCVMTGDYRYEISGPRDEVYRRMGRIVPAIQARLGTLGILGNHDAAEMACRFEQMGVRMLINASVSIPGKDSCLWFAGVDDPFDYRCADLRKAMSAVPVDGFSILLAHSPELYREASELGVRLYMCGHTHAGQVRLPVLGAVKKNAPVPRSFVQGHWKFGDMQGYTSWGAGCSTLPVRYGCPPEVTMIQLRRGKA